MAPPQGLTLSISGSSSPAHESTTLEGFVYLDPVQIVDAQSRFFEHQARGRDDALDLLRVYACSLQEPVKGMRQKGVGAYFAEGPPCLANGVRTASRITGSLISVIDYL